MPDHAPRIDARGMVVMPGGVDIHAHIAGPKVNAARRLTPEEHRADPVERSEIMRSGSGGIVPSTFVTGYRYALLGYTTVVEAATPPLAARHVLSELRDTPMIDSLFLVLLGNNQALFDLIRSDPARVRDAVAWWLEATGGYGVKLVNPGGVERWKRGDGNVSSLDDVVAGVTPREVLATIAGAVHDLELPHPVHVHCNNLGVGGNWKTTLDTLDTMEGRRAHLAHLQFHAYGGKPGGKLRSRAPELAEYLGAHPEFSADVGQVMFGDAMTMTADAPVSERLRDITGGKWVNADTEVETGCGIVPFTYREKNYVHALQWGIGLELFLLSRDPWRLVLSTDHPNGGSFLSYPRLIRLLMDREFRNEQLRKANKQRHPEHRAARRPRPRVLARGDRDHHARRAGAAAGPARQGPAGGRRRRRRDALRRHARPRGDVRHAALRDQGRPRGGARRRVGRGAGGRPAARRGGARPRDRGRPARSLRGALHRAVRQLSGDRAVAARARAAGRGGGDG